MATIKELHDLGVLSTRVYYIIRRCAGDWVGDNYTIDQLFEEYNEEYMLRYWRNFGIKALDELKMLASHEYEVY